MSCPLIGDFSTQLSRDFCRLTEKQSRGYYSPMMKFRDALIHKLEETGISLRKVSEGSGVSYEQLKKLKQVESRTTNVEDAIKVAAFFGQTVDEFVAGEAAKAPDRLAGVLSQLSPEGRAFLENAAIAQLAAEQKAPQKSDEEPQ